MPARLEHAEGHTGAPQLQPTYRYNNAAIGQGMANLMSAMQPAGMSPAFFEACMIAKGWDVTYQ